MACAVSAEWGAPGLVLVARSADEGYTPSEQAEELLCKLVACVERAGLGEVRVVRRDKGEVQMLRQPRIRKPARRLRKRVNGALIDMDIG